MVEWMNEPMYLQYSLPPTCNLRIFQPNFPLGWLMVVLRCWEIHSWLLFLLKVAENGAMLCSKMTAYIDGQLWSVSPQNLRRCCQGALLMETMPDHHSSPHTWAWEMQHLPAFLPCPPQGTGPWQWPWWAPSLHLQRFFFNELCFKLKK